MTSHRPLGTAVIVGGSMAGLFAARVLAEHCERVSIVERDDLPDGPYARRGVPQSRHVHVLLLRGVAILRARFPGLEEELLALGAPSMSWLKDTAALVGGSWLPRFDADRNGYSVSRDLLEWLVRQHLSRQNNVQFRCGHRVSELVANHDKSRISGVTVHTADGREDTLQADIVVDASGRSSQLPRWLERLGYAAPQESTVSANVAYATRWYKIPAGWQADWKMVLLASRFPDIPRGAVVQPVEGNRWVVTLVGYAGDHPPTDEEGFTAFARNLIGPQVSEVIDRAEPITGIRGYRRTENHWRHYERLERWPQGLVALGDAVCVFNPVYAQGMTVSALSAQILDNVLAKAGSPGLGLAFQKALAKMLQTPWRLATADDFRWAGRTAGDATFFDRLIHTYLEHVLDRIHQPDTCLTFFNVAHLLSPPVALCRPRISMPILWRMMLGRGPARNTNGR